MTSRVKYCVIGTLFMALTLNPGSGTGCAGEPVSGVSQRSARVGEPAPSFKVEAISGLNVKTVSLEEYRGKWLVLFFYPADFSFICPTEITGFNKELERFTKLNAEVLGGSVDGKYAHLAWIKRGDLGELKYPLFSDIKKEMAKQYGVLDAQEGVALRGLFIIDPNGIIQYQVVHNMSVGRNVEETLRVLEGLQTSNLCPLNWKPGQKVLSKPP
ncbi:MAG: peroxiredoxin [Desulfuromonadaceae bacterium]